MSFKDMPFKELRCCVKKSDGRPCGHLAVSLSVGSKVIPGEGISPVCEAHRIMGSNHQTAVMKNAFLQAKGAALAPLPREAEGHKEDWESRFKSLVQELDGFLEARNLWQGSYQARAGARLIQAVALAYDKSAEAVETLRTRVRDLEANLKAEKAVSEGRRRVLLEKSEELRKEAIRADVA